MTDPTDDERLAALQDAARALPREMEPPPDLLARVQGEIARRQVRPLSNGRGTGATPRTAARRWMLAAAALVLIGATSALTLMLARRGGAPATEYTAGSSVSVVPLGTSPARTAAMFAALDQYDIAARELSAAMARKHGKLRPETVAAVDRSLRTIDDAIAEARAALATDPASGVVYELLLGMYRQKLDLLKRSAALAAS